MIVVAKYDLIERSYTTVVVVIFRKLNLKPCSTIKNWRDFGLFIYCFEKKKKKIDPKGMINVLGQHHHV
jgi:hypothetical protein